MRLRHIEVFHAVYKYGSISAAARDLNVSQPSVSKVLRHAEDQLGYDLFDRKKGRLTPTPAAHELFGEVEDVYARMRSLHQTARNIASRKGGHLRIGVLPSLGFEVLPRAIARFREVSPETSFEIDTLHSKTLAGALMERECDIAVSYGDPARAGLVATPLGASELLLIEPVGDQTPERQGPAQFAELAFAQRSPGGCVAGVEPAHEADLVRHARTFHLVTHPHGAGDVRCYRLLAEDRQAGAGRGDHQIRMCKCCGRDHHGVDVLDRVLR
jgi:DNA-binding transcriptional LysR family regulator